VKARRIAALLAVACAIYLAVLGLQAIILIRSGHFVAVLLGAALLILPVVGAWVVVKELQFGAATQRLARILEEEGSLPADDLPRRPSGRPEVAAADARFHQRQQELDADVDNWRRWFLLAIAYDDAGDRRRGRAAMRKAVALHAASSQH